MTEIVPGLNPTLQISRCSRCGKLSTAKRLPKKHQRMVHEGQPDFDDELAEPEPWDYDGPSSHYIDCGPFVQYIAMPGRWRRV